MEQLDRHLKTPRVIAEPGPEYADRARKFQGIPTVERTAGGRLWAAWYGGGVWEGRDNYILLATSGDDGENWTGPRLVIKSDDADPVRPYDPCLWRDPAGRLRLFFTQGYAPVSAQGEEVLVKGAWVMIAADSEDPATRWSAPETICPGHVLNKPVVLSDGAWLLCVAHWYADGSARVYGSEDRGRTWVARGRAHIPERRERAFDEPMIVERRDGSLWMLLRTKYGVGESVSADRGRTWSDVAPSGIGHVSARFFLRKLASGRVLLVKHGRTVPEKTATRSHLCAFLSEDDGRTWAGGLLIDGRDQVSYPDGVQAPDGTVYLVHDFERKRGKEILVSRFTEEDILAGRPVSPSARLGMIVNKATGLNPTADLPGNPERLGRA